MQGMPVVGIDNELTKNIFSYVGLTFYAAHSLEESFRGLLVGLFVLENPLNWEEKYSKETEDINKLPLGKLLEKAKGLVSFESEIEPVLSQALKKRNHFIHFYFYDSFGLLSNPQGHQKIIDDMIELRAFFQMAESIIRPLSYELMIKAGMTMEQIHVSAQIGMSSQLKKVFGN